MIHLEPTDANAYATEHEVTLPDDAKDYAIIGTEISK